MPVKKSATDGPASQSPASQSKVKRKAAVKPPGAGPGPAGGLPGGAGPARKRGSAGPKPLGIIVSRLARPLLGRRGFAEGAIITRWEAIVGSALARWSQPIKIVFARGAEGAGKESSGSPQRREGTLHLKVAGGAFATEIAHLEPRIIDRINTHFGYAAVTRLRIVQGPLPRRPPPPAPPRAPVLPAMAEAALVAEVAPVADDDLRLALTRLGRAVLGNVPDG